MTAYNGTSVLSPHRAEDTLRCSATIIPGLDIHTITFPPEEIASVVPISQSDYTYVQQSELETAYEGTKVDSFLDDYYYRIHISPASIAFGSIVNPVEETFIVWNAWFGSKVCSSITEDNGDEYTLDPNTFPSSFMPLEVETYTVSVSTVGSTEFIANIDFNFSGETPTIIITGTRVVVFPFEPLIPMGESLRFVTDIIKARSGVEQRISINPIPQQGFKFDCHLKDEQTQARLDALLFNWLKRTWGIPIWGELVEHNTTINSGDTTIVLDTTNADYRDSSYAIIWKAFDDYESVKIDTVATGQITLEVPVQSSWIGKKWIMPLRIGHMISPINWAMNAEGIGKFSCSFLVKDNVLLTGYSATTTYLGLPVLPPSLEEGELDNTIDGDVKFIDYGLDDLGIISDSDHNIYVQKHNFRNQGKANIWTFRKFLHYLYGRRNAVWICSDKEDFFQTDTLGAAETQLTIDNVGWARNMTLNTLRTHIAFIFPDGRIYCREITGMTESGEEEIIGIDSALGIQVEPGDCVICMLDKCRLTEDKIEMEWEEQGILVCRTNFTRTIA